MLELGLAPRQGLDALAQLDQAQFARGHLFGQAAALARIVHLHQLVRVRERVTADGYQLSHVLRGIDEAQPVLQVALVLAQLRGQLAQAVAVLLGHALEHVGLFERRDVFALQVLDDGDLERGLLVEVLDDDGHLSQAGHLRRPPAALTGDDLVPPVGERANQHRLQHAVLADGRGQVCSASSSKCRLGWSGFETMRSSGMRRTSLTAPGSLGVRRSMRAGV